VSLLQVLGIKTGLIRIGEDLVQALQKGLKDSGLDLQDGDILVVSESVVATAEKRVANLDEVIPGSRARALAQKYDKDPREMELILDESDQIVGGIPGVVLTLNQGFLFPNAGIDHSNAPPGHVVLFPSDPGRSAADIAARIAPGKKIGVIIGDSRTHPLRLGCVGVALACHGLEPVEDARGQRDLYGRTLQITRKAVADNLVSAAQIVMGEGDESIPAAIIRNSPVKVKEDAICEMPRIAPEECMYIGALRSGLRPYTGGYDQLIEKAIAARENAYAPYSGFKVGAAILSKSGRIFSAGNVENASSGAGICAERNALNEALAAGERGFLAVAIAAEAKPPVPPCGICRQSLIEFGDDVEVIMTNLNGEVRVAKMADLLPNPFKGDMLKRQKVQ